MLASISDAFNITKIKPKRKYTLEFARRRLRLFLFYRMNKITITSHSQQMWNSDGYLAIASILSTVLQHNLLQEVLRKMGRMYCGWCSSQYLLASSRISRPTYVISSMTSSWLYSHFIIRCLILTCIVEMMMMMLSWFVLEASSHNVNPGMLSPRQHFVFTCFVEITLLSFGTSQKQRIIIPQLWGAFWFVKKLLQWRHTVLCKAKI